ncbi:MAG: hypothetical protein IJP58_03965 [Clostridia bacterium]|nr:hypothetical protein [Clostridia bacterium]
MACFLVPTTEAIVTTIAKKSIDKSAEKSHKEITNPFVKRMNWLNNMLWGGSALLAFEHVWHGEVTPWFPFLTNAANPQDAAAMLGEMATSCVAMAALVTAAWAAIVLVTNAAAKRNAADAVTDSAKA